MSKIKLILDGIEMDLSKDSYKETFSSVDSINESEAGTTLRAVIRTGIRALSVSYECIESEKVILDRLSKASSITAQIWDETEQSLIDWNCYMDGYSADLELETPHHRYYKVGFSLKDLED